MFIFYKENNRRIPHSKKQNARQTATHKGHPHRYNPATTVENISKILLRIYACGSY